jgi:hypothetical protein
MNLAHTLETLISNWARYPQVSVVPTFLNNWDLCVEHWGILSALISISLSILHQYTHTDPCKLIDFLQISIFATDLPRIMLTYLSLILNVSFDIVIFL